MRKLFLILSIITFNLSVLGQKELLRFNLTPGQIYYHSMQSSSTIKQQINGQNVDMDITISGKVGFEVVNYTDSTYKMNASYKKLTMAMTLPNGKMEFNSDKKDQGDIFSTILSALKDKQFTIQMTRVGKIIEVKNLDTIFENLLNQFPKLTSEQKQQFKGQLMQAYGEKAFRGSYEMVTAIYSNSVVEKGDTWNITTQLESGMAATLTTTFEFKDKTENYNLLVGNGKISTLDKDAYNQINGMPTRYDLTGTMNSTIKVDTKSGWIIEGKITQLFTGKVEIKDNQKLPGGMTIPMSVESEINYTSK